jgi:hypothetical protein
VAGVDTLRGIGFQQAEAVLTAIYVLEDDTLAGLRIEGIEDVIDLEVHAEEGGIRLAKQVKTRAEPYTWSQTQVLAVLRRWGSLLSADHSSFEFVTDGRLGPSALDLQKALGNAATGNPGHLARLLNLPDDHPELSRLARAEIRIRTSTTGALLVEAEHRLAPLLPSPLTVPEAYDQARDAINALFREMFEAGERPAPADRYLGRPRIAEVVGLDLLSLTGAEWFSELRHLYVSLAAVGTPSPQVNAKLVSLDILPPALRQIPGSVEGGIDASEQTRDGMPVAQLLGHAEPVVLASTTGAGKSTAAAELRAFAAQSDGIPVLVANAETYLPHRLGIAVTEAITQTLGRPVSPQVGNSALRDGAALVVVDGASEMDTDSADALREDLRILLAAGPHASILLIGRDAPKLRSLLPAASVRRAYALQGFDYEQQIELIRAFRGQVAPRASEAELRALHNKVRDVLGDDASSPLLVTMCLTLILSGYTATSRPELYQHFLDGMAARANVLPDFAEVCAVLGIAFALLLNDGRRYCDAYSWNLLLAKAVELVNTAGSFSASDAGVIDRSSSRSGVVTNIGVTGTRAAAHDSLADYLAALAHVRGLVDLPNRLQAADSQRVLFVAEMAGVSTTLAESATRDLPLVADMLAEFDTTALDEKSPALIAGLYSTLCGPLMDPSTAIKLWRDERGRVVALLVREDASASAWVSQDVGLQLSETSTAVVVSGGPLAAAARLWRIELSRILANRPPGRYRFMDTSEEARSTVEEHAREAALEVDKILISSVSAGARDAIRERLGPQGLTALVAPAIGNDRYPHRPMWYQPSNDFRIEIGETKESITESRRSWGQTSVEAYLDRSPRAEAAERVEAALKSLTGRR